MDLNDRITQHDFVDTNFGQSCSKIEIWFMCNCQTIVVLFLYPEIPPCRVFFGPGDRIFVCLRDCAIPHNCRFLPHNLPPKTRIIFFFFRTLLEGLFECHCSVVIISLYGHKTVRSGNQQ